MEHHRKSGFVGAFISGALAATALGGFMLFGSKNARKNRGKVEDWIEDAKAEVLTNLRKVRRLSREKYYDIVDMVSDKYAKMKDIGMHKADELREELKSRWEEIEDEVRLEIQKENEFDY